MNIKISKHSHRLILTTMIAGFLTFAPVITSKVQAAADPELPRAYVDTTYPTLSSSRTIRTVKTSCSGAAGSCYTNLQTAIDQAILGDEIVIDAGITISGSFTLKTKNTGSGWIIIRTSNLAGLPPAGQRVSPTHASAMPKIVASGNNVPAFKTDYSAHHYRLVGLEITEGPSDDLNVLVLFGSTDSQCATALEPYKVCDQSVLNNLAHHLIVDRSYIHGLPTHNLLRAVQLESKDAAVVDSYLNEVHAVGRDAQAIAGFNGPGPYKIVNNYLAGAGENIIFGGDDPRVDNLSPSDIEFRRNHFTKPLTWQEGNPSFNGRSWTVKNLFELKNAKRVLVESNIFENNWVMGQDGDAILFNTTNQYGRCSWCAVEDVTFQNNIVRHSAGAFELQGNDWQNPSSVGKTQRIKISNNIIEDIDGVKWKNLATGSNGAGNLFHLASGTTESGPNDVQILNNTGFFTGRMAYATNYSGGVYGIKTGLVFRDNIFPHNTYGVFGVSSTTGNDTLNKYFPSAVFTKNVIVGTRSATDTRDWSGMYSSYPGNYFPKTWGEIGFSNYTAGDYALSSSSVYRNLGTNSLAIGADYNAVVSATSSVIQGSTGSSGVQLKGDINLDHIVNSLDYSILNLDWFSFNARSDLNSDGLVNAIDYSLLNSNWFKVW